ncbi:histidine-specific methyltransferase [Poronia punctata]|nr:histidine-specific methyltransferase [Poronia punctata]
MAPSAIFDVPHIYDIRNSYETLDLKEEITLGLQSHPPVLPSLLLWNERGQHAFDRLSQVPSYYPFHGELDVLNRHGPQIGGHIPSDALLVELGCGAIRKTKCILSGFQREQKPVHYYALDVSRQSLESSLMELRKVFKNSPYITITGLLGTYDDCISWLSDLKHPRGEGSVTIMWLGNSIANVGSREEASLFLERFGDACRQSKLACRFLLSTDICQKDDKVCQAYDHRTPEFREFILNSLDAANLALGHDAFSVDDWEPDSFLDDRERNSRFFVKPCRDVLVRLESESTGQTTVEIRKGERVQVITSGKWSEDSMADICDRAGFDINQTWKDEYGDYCIFLLQMR